MSAFKGKCSVIGTKSPNLSRYLYTPGCAGRLARKSTILRAETEKAGNEKVEVDNCDYNIGDYCSIDDAGSKQIRTLGEMEQEFLSAMQAWYYDNESIMTDEEFENLKDELIWQGSEIAVLSSAEQKFLEASLAYSRGKQILSDLEYDALKRELKQQDSFVTQAGPRCSLRSRKMYSDLRVDYLKMTLLNVPAVIAVLSVLFLLDDITGFQVTKLIELPEPWGALVLWGIVLPTCFVLSQQLTNIVLRDGLILKGQCPNCGAEMNTYFGDIFTVQGNKDVAETACANCQAKLSLSNVTREAVVLELAEEKA